ncbi:hypothetical protein HCN44_011451 [Aphidius gifuensis]|uniref:Uncharacterized protein n=1 Tax=Aphidius gifuensis TaxID=684658 RepID=A0A834XX23_APHGI|nr:hypothetical protein HCN44_011451 [Aphidius gifuensis]
MECRSMYVTCVLNFKKMTLLNIFLIVFLALIVIINAQPISDDSSVLKKSAFAYCIDNCLAIYPGNSSGFANCAVQCNKLPIH